MELTLLLSSGSSGLQQLKPTIGLSRRGLGRHFNLLSTVRRRLPIRMVDWESSMTPLVSTLNASIRAQNAKQEPRLWHSVWKLRRALKNKQPGVEVLGMEVTSQWGQVRSYSILRRNVFSSRVWCTFFRKRKSFAPGPLLRDWCELEASWGTWCRLKELTT